MSDIQRSARVFGVGRPTMHLAVADPERVTICLTAPDISQDLEGQSRQVLSEIKRLLIDAGASRESILTAEVWLKDVAELDAFARAWNDFVSAQHAPIVSILRADMARPQVLVEVRVKAALAKS